MAPQNFAPAAANRPYLLLAGIRDGSNMAAEANALLALVASSRKSLRLFESDHQLPADYVPAVVAWLAEHLGVRP